jgi:hypothetical protein
MSSTKEKGNLSYEQLWNVGKIGPNSSLIYSFILGGKLSLCSNFFKKEYLFVPPAAYTQVHLQRELLCLEVCGGEESLPLRI